MKLAQINWGQPIDKKPKLSLRPVSDENDFQREHPCTVGQQQLDPQVHLVQGNRSLTTPRFLRGRIPMSKEWKYNVEHML